MTIPFMLFPCELQIKILNDLDSSTLATVSNVSKDLCAIALSILRRNITLKSDPGKQHRFLAICNKFIEKRLEQVQTVAGRIRRLECGKSLGWAMPYDDEEEEEEIERSQSWQHFINSSTIRTNHDVISSLGGLEELALFVEEPDEVDDRYRELSQRLRFPAFTKLQVGGNIPKEIVLALLVTSETNENVSCTALQSASMSEW